MEISSFRLLNVPNCGLGMIKCFSTVHRLHRFFQVRVRFRLCEDLPFNRVVLCI